MQNYQPPPNQPEKHDPPTRGEQLRQLCAIVQRAHERQAQEARWEAAIEQAEQTVNSREASNNGLAAEE